MKFFLLILVGLVGLSFGQLNENWNGYGDTVRVHAFYKDTSIVTTKFKLSAFENSRYDVYFRDTATAGFASDSVKFVWGIEVGHPAFSTTKASSPVMKWSDRIAIDTVNMLAAANYVSDTAVLLSDGTYSMSLRKIDTVSVSGWACQSRNISTPWDVYFRFWARGLAGNKASKKIDLVFQSIQRLGVKQQ